jgi:hypothetical protein
MARRVMMFENYWYSPDGKTVKKLRDGEDYVLEDRWADKIIKNHFGMEILMEQPDDEKMDADNTENKMDAGTSHNKAQE